MRIILVLVTVFIAEDTSRSVVKSLFNSSPETSSYVTWYFSSSLPIFIMQKYIYTIKAEQLATDPWEYTHTNEDFSPLQ